MKVAYFLLSLLCVNCKSENAISFKDENKKLIKCLTNIVETYFSAQKSLTYVDMNSEDYEILKAIHLSSISPIVFRQTTTQSYLRHQGYLINAEDATKFTECFQYLLEDPTWNPYSRFIVVIRFLKENELKKIFDELLKQHVVNVLVVNGTDDAHLYTYNPFDSYACGKYYNNVISYGLCMNSTNNLFPNKFVTGLRNCTFRVNVSHRPPFSIHPHLAEDKRMTVGIEQYLFQILADLDHFNVNFGYNYSNEKFTTISPDMKVSGPMSKLRNNKSDIMLGNTLLVSSRADAFTYLHGYLDYYEELRFFVRKASFVPKWKNAYLEFYPLVWCLLLLVYLLYSILMIVFLHAEDKINIILNMLRYLLASGCNMHHQMTNKVRCIFIIWMWFASLMNSIYQSSLVSLIEKPIKEYQVSDEADLIEHSLKSCTMPGMLEYIESETNISSKINYDCLDPLQSLKKVAQSKNLFTLLQKSIYVYNQKKFYDEFGDSPLYCFDKPYVKFILGTFFYKGFPLSDRMRQNALRLRENGLVYKTLNDHHYAKQIKLKFHQKEFKSRFVMPWFIYIAGCLLATIVFIFELLSKRFIKC